MSWLKRSMRPGFAGIDNPLYHDPKTTMLFGDAKDSLTKLVAAAIAAAPESASVRNLASFARPLCSLT